MSLDLTIDSALADPMIRAVMRADGVEPRAFETLLRRAASKTMVVAEPPRAPVALVAQAARAALRGCCRA